MFFCNAYHLFLEFFSLRDQFSKDLVTFTNFCFFFFKQTADYWAVGKAYADIFYLVLIQITEYLGFKLSSVQERALHDWDLSVTECKQNLKNKTEHSGPKSEYTLIHPRSGALLVADLLHRFWSQKKPIGWTKRVHLSLVEVRTEEKKKIKKCWI